MLIVAGFFFWGGIAIVGIGLLGLSAIIVVFDSWANRPSKNPPRQTAQRQRPSRPNAPRQQSARPNPARQQSARQHPQRRPPSRKKPPPRRFPDDY